MIPLAAAAAGPITDQALSISVNGGGSAPVFDSLLSESMEDLELRRKLAVGQGGSVR